MAHDIKNYDPLKSAREDVENIGKDLDKDFAKKPLELMTGAEQSAPVESTAAPSASEAVAAEPAPPLPVPEPQPEPAAAATPESTERTG
jgi:hypothetical protein